jgi:hypothetical protein
MQQITDVRDKITLAIDNTNRLTKGMIDGTPLILGAAAIVKELRLSLGPTPKLEDLWRSLLKDDRLKVSLCVCGWNAACSEIESLKKELAQNALSYRGHLKILSFSLEMLTSIVNDAYSSMAFQRMLTAEILETYFVSDDQMGRSVDEILNNLTIFLQSNAAQYFVLRYEQASELLRDFIATVSQAMLDLPDDKLIVHLRGSSRQADKSATRTAGMEVLLGEIENDIEHDTYYHLSSLIPKIEKAVSNERASRQFGEGE